MSVPPSSSTDNDELDLRRFEEVAEAACARLGTNEPVRRNLPGDGRLRMDRQLPFLCIYREPPGQSDAGTRELITTEAAYLFISGERRYHEGLCALCERIAAAMQEHFGTFLILEVWAQPVGLTASDGDDKARESFQVVSAIPESLPSTLDTFTEALSKVTLGGHSASVSVLTCDPVTRSGLPPIAASFADVVAGRCCTLGISVDPSLFRDVRTGTVFPVVLQKLRRQLARALRQAIAKFTGLDAGNAQLHYDSLGPSSLVKAARIVDQELSEVAGALDFLLQVTPINADVAWEEFAASGYRQTPVFQYRPLPYHPNLLKRRLFDIEIERIEDPTIALLFTEKQEEIDRKLTGLREIDTPHFLQTSLQLYDGADDDLVTLAQAILARPVAATDADREDCIACDAPPPERVTAREFVERARNEFDYYFQRENTFNPRVDISDEIATGLMVSQDRLLVSKDLCLPPERVEPLLHHEIGTHLLTYFNGRCQPVRQLYAGLAGYESLQEGLAVLAEHLCGGLSTSRLRTLAGRVMAVRSLTEGAVFCETFQLLLEEFGFAARQAFVTALRAHRAGGLTKDAVYLRGLRDLLRYLQSGHDIEPLYVGKIGLHHVPYVQELRRRGILDAPALTPRFWNDPAFRDRLDACRTLSLDSLGETVR
ncbi:MAG: DUF1704 domain-containing protein [Planctomycetaceae bacterium]|nr:DUF1704 domain-containing protein [Planctomycetaceae bacterium]